MNDIPGFLGPAYCLKVSESPKQTHFHNHRKHKKSELLVHRGLACLTIQTQHSNEKCSVHVVRIGCSLLPFSLDPFHNAWPLLEDTDHHVCALICKPISRAGPEVSVQATQTTTRNFASDQLQVRGANTD